MHAPTLHLDGNYINFLDSIKAKLTHARIRAALAVNKELILFYWQLGNELIAKQKQFKWGSQVLEQISRDLCKIFPEMSGFSVSNLRRMKLFALAYPDFEIRAQAVRELPWGHIVILLHKAKGAERDWYAQKAIENGWSRTVLEMQIKNELNETFKNHELSEV